MAGQLRQLDVSGAFLHCHLNNIMSKINLLALLMKIAHNLFKNFTSLNSLKQAFGAWFVCLFFSSIGFCRFKNRLLFFLLCRDSTILYILIYMDDIIVTCSNQNANFDLIRAITVEFHQRSRLAQLFS